MSFFGDGFRASLPRPRHACSDVNAVMRTRHSSQNNGFKVKLNATCRLLKA
jgi:hypothetical protein